MLLASAEGLLGLLQPAWQAVIAGCVLIILGGGMYKLLLRGPSRMGHAVLVTAGLIIVLTVLGALALIH